MQHNNRKHITPTIASQVLLALEVDPETLRLRAKLRRTYGPNGRRVEKIITGEAA
ncbi:MAG TPA: hypothetical protein PLJ35_05185 [Anaerolineae bacterium]|nr:hypothetical protein [Anaerolineae bacterium]